MTKMPENKFHIYYDREAGHYRVLLDGVDLSMNLATGGIKVDFSTMADDEFASPTVTLAFPATGGIEVILADGSTFVDGTQSASSSRRLCEPTSEQSI